MTARPRRCLGTALLVGSLMALLAVPTVVPLSHGLAVPPNEILPRVPNLPAEPEVAMATAPTASMPTTSIGPLRPSAASGGPYWTNLSHSGAPPARELQAMAYDAADHDVVMFGGGSWGSAVQRSDTWSYSAGNWTQVNRSVHPPALLGAMMAYDAKDGYAVLFGGYSFSNGFSRSTYVWSNGNWTDVSSSQTSAPSARWLGGLTYDAKDQYLVLFGGGDFSQYFNDTWTFEGGKWSQVQASTGNTWPAARSDVNLAYDPSTSSVILNSGSSGGSSINDTWSYSSGNWTRLNPNGSARSYSAAGLSYSPQYSELVRWGGSFTDNSTWTFSNGNWTAQPLRAFPPERVHPAMTYDAQDGYVLLVDGALNAPQTAIANDTWAFSPARLFGDLSVQPRSVDVGARLTVHAWGYPNSSAVSIAYYGLPPGCIAYNTTDLTCSPTTVGSFNVSANFTAPGGLYNHTGNLAVQVTQLPNVGSFTISPADVTVSTATHLTVLVSGGAPPYHYAFSPLPNGCTAPDAPAFSCTPAAPGQFDVVATVTDASSNTAQASASLVVNAAPSVRLTITPSTIDLGQTVRLIANVTGGTAPLSYVWVGQPANCPSVNTSTMTCTPNADDFGPPVNLTVIDADGVLARAFAPLTVNLDPSVSTVVVLPAGPDVSDPITFSADVAAGTAPFAFRWSGLPAGCASQDLPSFSCVPTAGGASNVTVAVTDGAGYAASGSASWVVHPLPGSAKLAATPNGTDTGVPLVFRITFSGGAAPYAFDWTGLPNGCANANASAISCVPSTDGLFVVQARVTDGWGHSTEAQVEFVVHPTIAITGFNATASTLAVGGTTSLNVSVFGGTPPFNYSYAGLPPGCPTANAPRISCAPTGSGAFVVRVIVTDAVGERANASTPIVVEAGPSSAGILGLPWFDWAVAIGAAAVAAVVGALLLRRSKGGARAPTQGAAARAGATPSVPDPGPPPPSG